MKLLAAFAALLLTACSTFEPQFDLASADQLIDYPIQNDQYAIVVLEEGISSSQARKMALQRAAEVTVESGNRYYTIESEQKTQVVKSNKNWDDNDADDGNLYQKTIVEQNFDKKAMDRQMPNTGETTVPALRLIIQCYPQKPDKRSYDACKSTRCVIHKFEALDRDS